mmetsp:Transcript_3401/g.7276  ORF Transcript_3401/g.7276 Transcript_3401/m.7276 type:complete len:116 (-) Transcript_3401:38-385(-)
MHIRQRHPQLTQATVNLPIEPAADHGWAHVIQGSIDVAGGGAMDEAAGIAVFTSGDHLTLSNLGESAGEVIVGAGKTTGEPFVKLLGGNGFVIAPTEAEAEAKMAKALAMMPKDQ